jgi:hypothetical protein
MSTFVLDNVYQCLTMVKIWPKYAAYIIELDIVYLA